MPVSKTTLILAFLALLFLAALIVRGPGNARHRRYVKKARRVMERLSRKDLSPAQQMAYLRKISPYVFEEAVLTGFENRGHKIKRNKRYSGDGGVDGQVLVDGSWSPIQCKRYRGHIDAGDVEKFARLCESRGVKGFFVHTGRTGKGARENAQAGSGLVRFVSGDALLALLTDSGRP